MVISDNGRGMTLADLQNFFVMHGDALAFAAMEDVPGSEIQVTGPDPITTLFERLHRSRLLSIAAIDGAARGGGSEFISAVDLRVGGPRTVLAQIEAALGLFPGWGGVARLPHLIGRSRALDILLTSRDVGAEEALAIGWLDRLVPSDEVLVEARRMARRVGAMTTELISDVKAIVDTSLGGIPDGLLAKSTAMLMSRVHEGVHRSRLERFIAAGGQTRDVERDGFEGLVQATIGDGEEPRELEET